MSEKVQSILQWEQILGYLINDSSIDLNKEVTFDEFMEIPAFIRVGCNHADRIEFLQSKGYEVTRENMLNSEL